MFDHRALKREQNIQSKKLLLGLLWAENQVFGHLHAASNRQGKVHQLVFTVVSEGCDSLLSSEAWEELGLVKRVHYVNDTDN